MKKAFVIFFSAILIVSLMFAAVGCKKEEKQHILAQNISYIQTALYAGQSLNFSVSVAKGRSEKLFIADGKSGELKEFNTLIVVPLNIDLFNNAYKYKLIGATGELEGDLTKDSFGASFSAELSDISQIGELSSITILSINFEDQIALANKLSDMIDAMEALAIAEKNLEAKIKSETADNAYNREIYIKFINDSKNFDSPYYWYVAYIASPTDYWTVLIDPTSGEVLSKKA